MPLSEINARLHRQEVREQARRVEMQALDTSKQEGMDERKAQAREAALSLYAPHQPFLTAMPHSYFAHYAHMSYVALLEASEWLKGEWELPEDVWSSQLRGFLSAVLFAHSIPKEERKEGDSFWMHVCDYAQRLYVSNNWWGLIQRHGELCYTEYATTRDDRMGRDQLDPREVEKIAALIRRVIRLPATGWVEVRHLPSEYHPLICKPSQDMPSG